MVEREIEGMLVSVIFYSMKKIYHANFFSID